MAPYFAYIERSRHRYCNPFSKTHEEIAEVRCKCNRRLELRNLVVIVCVEPLGHVQSRGSVNSARHGKHAPVPRGEVCVTLGHCAEELRPASISDGRPAYKEKAQVVQQGVVECV